MNDKLFLPGLILLLLGIFFGMVTPTIWYFIGDKNNTLTCCLPIIFNSILIILGICLIVLGNT